jgi:hypothetical protein
VEQYIQNLFPRSQSERTFFTLKLTDILNAGLTVKPVNGLEQHLTFEGHTVYVLSPNLDKVHYLLMYSGNLLARYVSTIFIFPDLTCNRALNISTLGQEVFASLSILYGYYGEDPELMRLANHLKLRPCEEKLQLFDESLIIHKWIKPQV